jgi:hypothetical protein
MKPKRQRRLTIEVQAMFEPDRIARMNLQAAYEKIIPPQRFRMVSPTPESGSEEIAVPVSPREEVTV